MTKNDLPMRPPDRAKALGQTDGPTDGWIEILRQAGFRIEGEDGIMPPCRITDYPGVAVYVEQWDKP